MKIPELNSRSALVAGLACGLILALAAAPALAAEPPAAGPKGPPASPTITFSELSRGQKGYGFSVFAGTEPERFEVEVLGVQKANEIAGLDFLITRLSGMGLEKIGVAAGMSGSPVYFDGRLAGAVAFTYNFASEPIAGITPIGAMRAIPHSGLVAGALAEATLPRRPGNLPRVSLEDLRDDVVSREAFDAALELLAPSAGASGRSALSFAASGLGGEARQLLESRLGSLATLVSAPVPAPVLTGGAGGGASGGGRTDAAGEPGAAAEAAAGFGGGDSVALVMVRGDLSLAAVGTLTDRIDDQVVAFGHKIFGGYGGIGPIRFPLAEAEVVTVVPGLQGSFKIANVGPLLGSFLEDRGAGVRGVLGPVWPMTPLNIRVHPADGGPPRDFKVEVTNDPLFRGFLMVLSVVGGIAGAGRDQGAQSVDLDVRFQLADGHAEVAGRHHFAGGQAAFEAAFQVMEYATFFAFNDYRPVDFERVDVELRLHDEELRTRVLAAWPERRKVAPGELLGFWVELEDYRGERRRERFEFRIPADVAGRFYLMIGDGRSADEAYAKLEKAPAQTLEQGLEQLRHSRSSRNLYVFGLEGGAGISIGGRALPDLPGSQRALFGAAADAPLPWRIAGEQVFALDRAASGMVRIDLEVERRQGRGNAP